jgi:hypothetical protein
MELDGLDLLSRSNKTMLEGIQRISRRGHHFFGMPAV